MSVDAPVSVDEILSAFGDDDYWQARLAAYGRGTAALDTLTVGEDGAVTAVLTVSFFRDRLPKMITTLHGGELIMKRTEKWVRIGDGRVGGEIRVAVPGAPVVGLGEVLMEPRAGGSQLQFATTVEVRIPVLGGQIESFIVGQVKKDVVAVQQFTNEWIVTNR